MSAATLTAREAVELAAETTPAEHAARVSRHQLAAQAPVLPPLKMPKLSDRTLNGRRVEELIAAGPRAVMVHSNVGVRIIDDVRQVQDNPDLIVIAEHREVARLVTLEGLAPLTAAQRILDRELAAIRASAA